MTTTQAFARIPQPEDDDIEGGRVRVRFITMIPETVYSHLVDNKLVLCLSQKRATPPDCANCHATGEGATKRERRILHGHYTVVVGDEENDGGEIQTLAANRMLHRYIGDWILALGHDAFLFTTFEVWRTGRGIRTKYHIEPVQ
jgi:hypothetical protein